MTVLDASVVVAALVEKGSLGAWARAVVFGTSATAPHVMPAETANILRRHATAGLVSPDVASLAHRDLLDLNVTLTPYATVASRVWQLRHNLTAYDAWYVALAEILGAPLATLDVRLARAAGPRCEFLTPP